jgi:hypothetical protein
MSMDYASVGMAVGGFLVGIGTTLWGYIKKPKETIREIQAPKTEPDAGHIASVWVNFARLAPDVDKEIKSISREYFRIYRKMYMEFLKSTGVDHSGIQDNDLVQTFEQSLRLAIIIYIQPFLRRSVYRNGLVHSDNMDNAVLDKLISGEFIQKRSCVVYDWYFRRYRGCEKLLTGYLSKKWRDKRLFTSFSAYCKSHATNEIIHNMSIFYDNCYSKRDELIEDMLLNNPNAPKSSVILKWEEHYNKLDTDCVVF